MVYCVPSSTKRDVTEAHCEDVITNKIEDDTRGDKGSKLSTTS